jgi:hypothetical protein
MAPFPYGAMSNFLQSSAGTWQVILTPPRTRALVEPDPRSIARAILALTLPPDRSATVVILDGLEGSVQFLVLRER